MKIVEIKAQANGAHRNQTVFGELLNIPEGWAVIPDEMVFENFPFGEVEAEEVDGVLTVTKWTAGTMPEPEEFEVKPTAEDMLNALVGGMSYE